MLTLCCSALEVDATSPSSVRPFVSPFDVRNDEIVICGPGRDRGHHVSPAYSRDVELVRIPEKGPRDGSIKNDYLEIADIIGASVRK